MCVLFVVGLLGCVRYMAPRAACRVRGADRRHGFGVGRGPGLVPRVCLLVRCMAAAAP
jgi:hypothetical protein